jgi:hypothetical protein
MELQKGPTMTRTQEWNCLSAQQLVHQLLVCDIERARRFVQANANDWLAERGGFCPATENKPLASIDPDFAIKNDGISAPKCNHECNHIGCDYSAESTWL